jgi:hypothetical protein
MMIDLGLAVFKLEEERDALGKQRRNLVSGFYKI